MRKKEEEITINLRPKKSWGHAFPNVEIKKTQEGEEIIEKTESGSWVKFLDRLTVFSLAMIFLGVPLFFTNLTFQGIVFEKQIFFYFWVFVALVAWAAKGIILGEMKIKKSPIDLPLGIFWVAYLLATIFSVDRWHSFWGMFGDPSRGLVGITALIIAFYLIRNYFTFARLKIFIGALIFSGSVVSLWSILNLLQIKIFSDNIYQIFPLNLSGSALDSGILISMLIPIVIVAIFKVKDSRRISKYVKYSSLSALSLALILFVLALVLFTTSAPWIGVLVGLGFLLVFLVSRIIPSSSSSLWIPMMVFVIAFSVMMIGVQKTSPMLQFFHVKVTEMPASVFPGNLLSWEISKEAVKDRFALGSGPSTFSYAFSKYKPANYNFDPLYTIRHREGRGIFFEYASTIGLLGILSFMVLVLSFLSVVFYLLLRKGTRNKLYSLGLFSAGLVFLVDAIIFPLRGTILIIGTLLAALALSVISKESESVKEENLRLTLKASPQYALALAFIYIVICVGAVVAFVFLGKVYIAENYAGKALREGKISEEGSISKMNKAIELYNKEARYFSRVGQEYMFLANQEALKKEGEKEVNSLRGYINGAIDYSETALKISPKDVSMIENLSQIYENTGYFASDSLVKAEEYYNLALELEPENPFYYLKLGQIKLGALAGKEKEEEKNQIWEEAKKMFEKSVEKKPDYDSGYYNLSLAKNALKDKDGAISEMEKALLINPRILEYRSGLGRLYVERGEGDDYKVAEEVFLGIKNILENNIENLANLAFLYEKTERNDEAIVQYEKILSLLPEESVEARDRVKLMISNIRRGIENTPENLQGRAPEEDIMIPEDLEDAENNDLILPNEEEIPEMPKNLIEE